MNARMSSWKEHPFSDTELEELIRGIDPATSKIHWRWGQILDPYGINRPIPEECDQIGRVYFVKSSRAILGYASMISLKSLYKRFGRG
jgi:hypothetical protein